MAGIAAELLGWVEAAAAHGVRPRIGAIHLPQGFVGASRDAEFCAVELDDGCIGFSFVLLGATLPGLAREEAIAQLPGRAAAEVAAWYAQPAEARRAIGLATINALTQSVFRRAGYRPDDASDSLGLVEPQPDDHVGMIGLFRPLVGRILDAGARLTVAELKPELAQQGERFRVTLDPAELESCNKVVSTSTLLLNDTLDGVLAACRAARRFAIVGPGAGCMPDPLFRRGVDSLGGMEVVDAEGFRRAFRSGEPWGGFARKTCIRRDRYPGFATLLSRVR